MTTTSEHPPDVARLTDAAELVSRSWSWAYEEALIAEAARAELLDDESEWRWRQRVRRSPADVRALIDFFTIGNGQR